MQQYQPIAIFPLNSGLSQYFKPFLVGGEAFTELENAYQWRGLVKKREGSTVLSRTPVWITSTGITNASPPVVTAAAHGLLSGDMVYLENVATTNGTITAIAPGVNSTVITTTGAHGIVAGDLITVYGQNGITLVDGNDINEYPMPVISVTVNTITVAISTIGTWTSGGVVSSGVLNLKAFQITKLTANTFSLQYLSGADAGSSVIASGTYVSADIYLPIVGTRTFVVSSDGNEQLIVFTPKRAYLYNTSTFALDNISFDQTSAAIVWTGTKDNFFYTSNYATAMWTTNNVDVIRYYNGSTTAGWVDFQPSVTGGTTLDKCLMILPYKGRLVALNTVENGVNYFSRARWCQLGTPFVNNPPGGFTSQADAWRSDIVGKGGFFDADTSERIVSAQIIQDTLIVAFQFSTWRLRYTGNEILPFVWERINTQLGAEGTFTSVPFDDGAVFISRRGIIKSSFNDCARIDKDIPNFVDRIENGSSGAGNGIARVQGVRDYQKRMVYWIYGDEGSNAQTPDQILCFNYEDNTWSTFNQSFTCLGNYKSTVDNTWSTWTSIWEGDTSQWNTPIDQSNTIIIVAGDVSGRIWRIMNSDVSTDNGESYDFNILTGTINPFFKGAQKARLAYYDLYVTNTDQGYLTLENYVNDNQTNAVVKKTVRTNSGPANTTYVRVFVGADGRNHQIRLRLTEEQMLDSNIANSPFELQGIIMWFKSTGRIFR